MAGRGVLFVMSNERSRQCPDALEGGTRFENACCDGPIRVLSRASFATGRYVHKIGCRDNAFPIPACRRAPLRPGRQAAWP